MFTSNLQTSTVLGQTLPEPRTYQTRPDPTRLHQALLDPTRPYQTPDSTVPGPTRPYQILPGPTRPYQTLFWQEWILEVGRGKYSSLEAARVPPSECHQHNTTQHNTTQHNDTELTRRSGWDVHIQSAKLAPD